MNILKKLLASKQFENRYDLLDFSISKITIEGLYLEFGVFQGDTLNHIANKINNKIYGFDSFKGLPENWSNIYSKGHFAVTVLPKISLNAELVVGLFNETLCLFLKEHLENCAFIHIDCDIYSSAKTVLNKLKSRIVYGTIIQFDEFYNYTDFENHEIKAFLEYVKENNVEYKFIGHCPKAQQAAVKIIRKIKI